MDAWIIRGLVSLKDDASAVLDKVQGKFKTTNEQTEKSTSRLSGVFSKLGPAIAGAFAVKKVIDFGKEIVNAAATTKAIQAQFDQVFDGIVDTAEKSLRDVAGSVGAIPSRIKPAFNAIASFAKVAGMDTAESLAFTERATKAAADTAAFYDKSLEDTTETLKSYLKGNFSVADNLGILSTETTRNAAATELFGQKYKDLSGIQQQEVLLRMYEDANKVSGAIGQAARETDGYENVMGNLKQAFNDFKAIIGGPILGMVVPALQKLTGGLLWISDAIKGFDFSKLTEGTGIFATFARTIMELWENNLKPIWDAFKVAIDQVIAVVVANFPAMEAIFMQVFNGIVETLNTLLKPAFDWLVRFVQEILLPAFQMYWPLIQEIVTSVFTMIGDLWTNTLKPAFDQIVAFIVQKLYPQFERVFPIIQEVVKTVFNTIKNIWENILQPAFIALKDFLDAVLKPAFEAVFPIIESAVKTAFDGIVFVWNSILKPAFNMINDIIKNTLKPAFDVVFPAIKNAVVEAFKAIKNVWENTLSPAFEKIKSFIANILQPAFAMVFDAIKRIVEIAFKNIVTAVQNTKQEFDKIKTTIGNVLKWFGDLKTGIGDKINAAKDLVKNAIDAIKGFFNFKISWPNIPMPRFGITPSGWSIGDLLRGSIPKLGITWNADGAIFQKPTVLTSTNGLQGVAEAGDEAILPISKLPGLLKPFFALKDEVKEKSKTVIFKTELYIENFVNNTDDDIDELTQKIEFKANEKLALVGGDL